MSSERTGYPTGDVSSSGAVPTPADGVFYTKVDDDGDAGEYFSLIDSGGLGGFWIGSFSDFGALPTGDTDIILSVWMYWSGATPVSVSFDIMEGGTSRGSSSLTPSGSNTGYDLIVSASSFSSVGSLRASVVRPTGGSGSLVVTGVKISMEGPAFAHLDLVNGLWKVVPAGTLGEIHLSGGLPVRSSHGERYGSSLILVNGLPKVQAS